MPRLWLHPFTAAVLAAVSTVVLPAPAAGAVPQEAAATIGDTRVATPAMLAAMRRDLGLTDDQARARLAVDDRARRTAASLQGPLGPAMVGSWLPTGADQLSVAITDATHADTVRAAGAHPVLVRHTAADLGAAMARLDQQARRGASPAVPAWYVDVATNSVTVLAHDLSAAARFVADSGADPSLVRVRPSAETPTLKFDLRGGERYWAGPHFCSVGLPVDGGFVTAGHCGNVGDNAVHANGVLMGAFQASDFGWDGDFGWVATTADWVPQPWVNRYNGTDVTVIGATVAMPGTVVCRFGATTGLHCGTVDALNITVSYHEGPTVTGLTRTTVCIENGDSGGPYLSGGHAQGVASGGSGDCRYGGTSYFQPLGEILTAYGLNLRTEPKPACNTYNNRYSGFIARAGGSEFEPSEAGFQAGAGTHRACLSAAPKLNFKLQKFLNRQWLTVASTSSDTAGNDYLEYTGTVGKYRYVVHDLNGAGSYTLGYNRP